MLQLGQRNSCVYKVMLCITSQACVTEAHDMNIRARLIIICVFIVKSYIKRQYVLKGTLVGCVLSHFKWNCIEYYLLTWCLNTHLPLSLTAASLSPESREEAASGLHRCQQWSSHRSGRGAQTSLPSGLGGWGGAWQGIQVPIPVLGRLYEGKMLLFCDTKPF